MNDCTENCAFSIMTYLHCVLFMFFMVIHVYGRPENQLTNQDASSGASLLTSSYSQVSRWGAGRKTMDEGRSNVGQTPWTQSSDAHVVRGQNIVSKNRRVKISNKNYDTIVDNAGEVIQERFNPRPWFAYEATGGKGPAYIPPAKPSNNNQPDYAGPNFDSFPLAVKPSDTIKPSDSTDKTVLDMDTEVDSYPDTPQIDDTGSNGPPANTYGSPYNSYYPASDKPPADSLKKPNNFVTRPYDDYLPPEMAKPPQETHIAKHPEPDNMGDSMADLPKHVDPHYFNHDHPAYSSAFHDENPPDDTPSDSYDSHGHSSYSSFHDDHDAKPPKDASSDSYDSYNHSPYSSFHDDQDTKPPKDTPSDLYHSHDHAGFNDDHDDKPPKDTPSDTHDSHGFPSLPSYIEHDPHVHGHSFDPYQFPYDHHPHIYHEVKATTTEAPEKERLSKRPYSYYYLGRKLWYIPLYFSVYFIVYIFVLILKSIARHKITFNHYFEDDKREMKDMHAEHEEYVHELEDHVGKEINNARRKYVM